jgi:hypothetical protein
LIIGDRGEIRSHDTLILIVLDLVTGHIGDADTVTRKVEQYIGLTVATIPLYVHRHELCQ